MGIGFRLNPKWVFPTQTHLHFTSPSKLSSSARAREGSFNSAKSSYLSVVSEEGDIICKERFKVHSCSSTCLQILENDYSEMETIKMYICKRSHNGLGNMIDDKKISAGEDIFVPDMSSRKGKTSHFSLLLDNLNVLEQTFTDSNALKLEMDILTHLGKLGALKLFDTFLMKTLETSTTFGISDVPVEHIGEPISHVDKIAVRSGKKEDRKSRRQKALENASRKSLPSKAVQNVGCIRELPAVSSAEKASNSQSRRLMISRNEAEMSRGFKVAANLERIRATLEKETGQVVSYSCWAEATGLNEKVLQQQLRFGWYCRDELLRTTRSLVLFLARNYRGHGIPLEDLLQAGLMGVLQGAERFDHTRGYRLSTYVQYWIRKSMSRMVTQHGSEIKVPYTLNRAINQIQKARKSLNSSHKKYPDDNEIAMFTGLSLAKIRSANKCQRVVGSVNQQIGDGFSAKYMEILPDMSIESPEGSVMRQHMKKEFHTLLKGLSSKERQVLVLRYGLEGFPPKTLEEIGRSFNVSKEWVRRIQKKAMTKLRDTASKRNLSHCLRFIV